MHTYHYSDLFEYQYSCLIVYLYDNLLNLKSVPFQKRNSRRKSQGLPKIEERGTALAALAAHVSLPACLVGKLVRLCGPQQYTKHTKYTKYIKYTKYGNYRYNKVLKNVFLMFLKSSKPRCSKVVWCFWCILYNKS